MKNLNCSFVGMNIKNKIVRVVSFLIAPIIFLSCNSPSNKEVNSDLKPLEYPVELDIETLINRKAKMLSFNEIIDTIEFIPLETKNECLVGRILNTVFNSDYIFINQPSGIFQFSSGGNFIRQVGQRGRGPGEYMQMRDIILVNDTLFVKGRHKVSLSKTLCKRLNSYSASVFKSLEYSVCCAWPFYSCKYA